MYFRIKSTNMVWQVSCSFATCSWYACSNVPDSGHLNWKFEMDAVLSMQAVPKKSRTKIKEFALKNHLLSHTNNSAAAINHGFVVHLIFIPSCELSCEEKRFWRGYKRLSSLEEKHSFLQPYPLNSSALSLYLSLPSPNLLYWTQPSRLLSTLDPLAHGTGNSFPSFSFFFLILPLSIPSLFYFLFRRFSFFQINVKGFQNYFIQVIATIFLKEKKDF